MSDTQAPEIKMDPTALYQEELFTDQQAGTLRRMTPVLEDGSRDETRPILFVGQAQIMTPMGAMPISFRIEAETLAEAVAGYGTAAQAGIKRTAREIEEMQRQQASQIVMPGGDAGGMGGAPGGSKIQMR